MRVFYNGSILSKYVRYYRSNCYYKQYFFFTNSLTITKYCTIKELYILILKKTYGNS